MFEFYDREEELKSDEINRLITMKKYALLDFYFKLSLRNYLHKMNYRFLGKNKDKELMSETISLSRKKR